ncbi:oocyte zinc finger protein XlCOF28-like [Littorina saxatilis]|uniref:oocyte zinc finger protein XlCOF28-like n=1 Tax=Littorina saxatilis TaxID=31220 RepID=UPI0038B58FD6
MDSLSFETLDSIHEISHEVVVEAGGDQEEVEKVDPVKPMASTSMSQEVGEEEQQEEVLPGQPLATSTPTQKSHLCNTCGKMYARKWALVEHERHYHKIGGGSRYTCPYCDKEFMAKYSFQSHINGHEGKKPFSCSTCNKIFV